MELTEKHRHILAKAEALFAEKGFEGTTVRDIANFADVNLAMISYYFGSKEKLMEVLFKDRMEVSKIKVEEVVGQRNLSPLQKLEILTEQYIDRVFANQNFYRVLLTEQILNKNQVVLKSIKQYKIGFMTLIEKVIKEGQQSGEFGKEIDTMIMLTSMKGTVMHTVVNKDEYKTFHQLGKMNNTEFEDLLKTKLKAQIKRVFKATVQYEQ